MDSYITYDPDTREITGGFLQDIPEGLEHFLLADDHARLNWPMLMVNETYDGFVTRPAPPPPAQTVPEKVTRRQARQALLIRGLLDLVVPAIESIEDPLQRGLALIEWEDATEFERNRELVIQIGAALGLDSAGLDELFIFAATL